MRAICIILLLASLFLCFCCNPQEVANPEIVPDEPLDWLWISSERTEKAHSYLVHEELFGNYNSLRLLQSSSLYDNKAFCFSHGSESYVFDIDSKKRFFSYDLPEISHHNNAQFLDMFYQVDDKYPLLLLSRGDYPPNQNECYIVRVQEKNDSISYTRIKTIKNTLAEAKYGGSWVADTKSKTLYMYTMTKGDWRVKEDNKSCVYSFELPDLLDPSVITLGYDDVIDYWEFTYFIYQGGVSYNGYLFFNVQNLTSIEGITLENSKNVLAVNARRGTIDAVLPLMETLETEGISVYNGNLFISFKNGSQNQKETDIVFKLKEYTLPVAITNRIE